jgi:chromosome segregation and condensation protein ScpB
MAGLVYRPPQAARIMKPTTDAGDGSLAAGERKILVAIAQNDGADREQLTVLTGYRKSTRDAYIQRLQAKGFVTTSGRSVVMTQEGIDALGDYERLPTGERLREYWLARLPEGESKILTIVCHAWPNAIARDDIDAGYQKSSRDAYIQRLAAKKLVATDRGTVTASANLFD